MTSSCPGKQRQTVLPCPAQLACRTSGLAWDSATRRKGLGRGRIFWDFYSFFILFVGLYRLALHPLLKLLILPRTLEQKFLRN